VGCDLAAALQKSVRLPRISLELIEG
jgi:hypothetical protein